MIAAKDRKIHMGGLMRCCIETLTFSDMPSEIGSVMNCMYCKSPMLVADDGAWQWDHSE